MNIPQRYGVSSLVGKRASNEDTFRITQLSTGPSYFGLFDGHGGEEASVFCQKSLHDFIDRELRLLRRDVTMALRTGILEADDYFISTKNKTSGSTVLIVLFDRERIYVAWLGDTQVSVIDRNGRAIILNRKHVASDQEERKSVEKRGGNVGHVFHVPRVNGILAVTRSIGNASLKPAVTAESEVIEFRPSPLDEWFLLATDGFWDVMKPEDIGIFFERKTNADDLNDLAKTLAQEAISRGSKDNVTVIVVQLK